MGPIVRASVSPGSWALGLGFQDSGFRVWGLGLRVSGLRVQGLGFRVQGLGFRVHVPSYRVGFGGSSRWETTPARARGNPDACNGGLGFRVKG